MEVRLLGPVGLWREGTEVELARSHRRCVLAVLAMTPGQPVSADTLVDRVWGDQPPQAARRSLYSHVSVVRRRLSEVDAGAGWVSLRAHDGSYRLDVDPDLIDLHRARRLLDEVHRLAGNGLERDQQAVAMLREAYALWRGTPLSGLKGGWAARTRAALEQERLTLAVERYRLELRTGGHTAAVAPLTELLTDHPLVEPLAGLLMLALYRCGRQAEVLEVYSHTRQQLVDEIGDEPGTELRTLHEQVLRRDPTLDLPTGRAMARVAEATVGVPTPVPPAQLPADVAGFTGRAAELDQLDATLATVEAPPGQLSITTIEGTAGVGKTALAIHWGHRVAGRFPDGQLYLNLRGFDASGTPVAPGEAIRDILEALQVPPQRVPTSLDAQVGQYRSLLAGHRILVVLDNARDAGQVRPLLPGAPGCMAIVTSRNRLASLIAAEGARPLNLDLLTPQEARELLARRLGHDRVAAEPDAVEEIVVRCARLPLALAIVAARAAVHPRSPLRTLAQELPEAGGDLDAWGDPGMATDLRAVFSWSHHALSNAAAELFALLGIHPGPDLTAPAAASLAGTTVPAARRCLSELARVHLITEHIPGRYTLHDLLRAYATETAATLPGPHRRAGLLRLLDYYLHTSVNAALLLSPYRTRITPPTAETTLTPDPVSDDVQAMRWFGAEHHVLRAAVAAAAHAGFATHSWQLAWALAAFHSIRGLWREELDVQRIALRAARRLADQAGQAQAHRFLGFAHVRVGSHDEAHPHLREALDLFRALGDHIAQAEIRTSLGMMSAQRADHREAIDHFERALDGYRGAGHRMGEAFSLNNLAFAYGLMGEYQRSLGYCQESLALHEEVGNRRVQAATWDTLGYSHHHLGDHHQAVSCYQRALQLYREAGDPPNQAEVLTHLGETYDALGKPDAARDAWQQALEVWEDLDHPNADQLRARLRHG
jgi:DNA-binding SARP family transcriptional activator/tetratricopeptide (TPR) repeat protein